MTCFPRSLPVIEEFAFFNGSLYSFYDLDILNKVMLMSPGRCHMHAKYLADAHFFTGVPVW